MPIISARQAQQLSDLFAAQASDHVSILFFTQQAQPDASDNAIEQASADARALLTEVAALAPAWLTLEPRDLVRDATEARALGIERTPAITLRGKAAGLVRTFGVPANYEFTTLINDLLDLASGGHTELSERTRESLALLRRPVHLQVFETPT
ncbi:MAG TPA: hypothetical protein VE338_20370 [Ktedonobacterales bacterium]|jgi:hypothetical protein|nr:hypothetical protein [Ktedonobacterales bacterium]